MELSEAKFRKVVEDERSLIHSRMKENSSADFKELCHLNTMESMPRMDSKQLSYRIAVPDDFTQIDLLLQQHFISQEPTDVALGLNRSTPGYVENLQEVIKQCLTQPYTFVAISEEDEIVGVRLNELHKPSQNAIDDRKLGNAVRGGLSAWEILQAYLAKLEEDVDRLIPEDCRKNILKFSILCVHQKFRRLGIAAKLVDLSLQNARMFDFCCVFAVLTAKATQNLFKKDCFEVLRVIKHKDFVDENGKILLNCNDGTDQGLLVFKRIQARK
ncbi:uncharacterized protein LOC135686790 isoform X2 [Rhopilema esculentum]|uniref:uncharacterized protein LOC135686790 isoform X2 n=1 Tax=Rhopilema esculentum TaxID=499914 RepID=UPI0031E2A04A